MNLRKSYGDTHKYFDEMLIKKSYGLISVYLSLKAENEELMSSSDRKHLIEKALPELSPFLYGQFQFTNHNQIFKESMEVYAEKSSSNKSTISKLKDAIDKIESKIVDKVGFRTS